MSGVAGTVGKIAGVVAFAALALSTAGVATIGVVALKSVATYAALASTAASVGASLTASTPPRQGSVSQTTIGSDQASPWIVGRTYYGGSRVQLVGYGATLKKVINPYLLASDVHSVGGPVDGLEAIYADLAPIAMRAEGPVAGTNGYFHEHLWRSFQLGQQVEAAALPLRFPGAPGWGASACLSGKAAIAYNALFDRDGKVFASGFAQMGAVWRGARCWNPVEDSTYPGGAGASRWAPPGDTAGHDAARATWAFTRSPGLLALRYALGIYERDTRVGGSAYRKTFGAGIPLDGLIVEQFVHLHNVCAANGWNCDGMLFEPSSSKWDNLKRILAAGGAEPCWIGGRLGVRVNAPRIALDTITASDLAEGEIVVGAMQGWEQRLNTIVPKYRSETHRWEYVATDPVQIATYLAEDGEEKREERQYDLVQDPTQARQLAAYELLDRRELGEIELPCKPRLRRYGPGDLLYVNLPDAGLVNQPAVVLRRTLDPATMGVTLVLRGETMAKHDFALGRTGTPPPTPALVATPSLDEIALERPVSWDTISDPIGTKPADNATNGADPNSPFGPDGKTVGDVQLEIDAARAQQEYFDKVTIPAVEKAVDDAGKRIDEAATDFDLRLDGASKALADEITRAKGEEEELNRRVNAFEAGNGYDDTELRTKIEDVDTARADDARALGERISRVQSTVTRGGGNRVPNTDFVSLDGWTVTYNGVNAVLAINASGDLWHPIGENVISFYQQGPQNGGGYVHVFSENFAVYPGEYIQFYADAAAHRADGWISVFWFDANGGDVGYAGENGTKVHDNGGRSPTGWERIGQKSVRVPDNAVTARLALRKSDTFAGANPADSYAWFWRPYVGDAIKDQGEWNAYSRGTNGVVQVATNALIEERRRTLAAVDKAIAERVTKTEAQLGGGDPSGLSARIEATELAVTDGRFAGAERVTVLEASSGGGGNLLSNTDWSVDAAGWTFYSESGSVGARNGLTAAFWWPEGMNALVIGQENAAETRAGHWSIPVFGIEPGKTYQASVYTASHRCATSVYLDFYDAAGNHLGTYAKISEGSPAGAITGYNRAVVNVVAPPGSVRVNFYLIKYGTTPGQPNSYAWFVRPQLSEVRANITSAVPYVPGSGDAAQVALTARVALAEKAASDGQLALAGRASTVEAAIYARSPAALNANANLSNWPDVNGLPVGWGWWNASPGGSRRVPGLGGRGFGFGHDTPADIPTGLGNGPIGMDAGWWVFEGETILIAGTYQGVGMTVDGVFYFDFSREEDTNGVIGIYGYNQRRRWSKMFYSDRVGNTLHLMNNWGPFSPMVAKNIEWYACGVRPASAAEIAARKAIDTTIPAVAARVKSTEDAIADAPNRYAAAARADQLEAQVNFATDSGLKRSLEATVESRAAAIADDRSGAVARTVEGIRANFEGRIAGVEQSAGAISAIDGRTEYYWQVTGTAPDGNAMIRLAKKDGSAPVFYVGANMIVDGSLLVTQSITTLKVQDNAITGVAWGSVGGIFHYAGGQYGEIKQVDSQRLALGVSGKRVRVDYQFSGNQSNDFGSTANATGTVALFCAVNGGTPFQMANRRYPLYLGNPQYFGGFELTTPPAGTVEFFLRLTIYYATGGSAAYEVNDILLTIEETKK